MRKEKEDLRKEKEDLRKKELLLLEISKNESESKALIYSLQYSTKLSSRDIDSIQNFTLDKLSEKRANAPTAPPGNSITIPQVLPHSSIAFPFCLLRLSVPPSSSGFIPLNY